MYVTSPWRTTHGSCRPPLRLELLFVGISRDASDRLVARVDRDVSQEIVYATVAYVMYSGNGRPLICSASGMEKVWERRGKNLE